MNSSCNTLMRWLFCAATFLAAGAGSAQPVHELRIESDQVFINGRLIPPSELPGSLETEGITAKYTFSGDAEPVIRIGGEYFVFDGDSIRAAGADERDRVSVFFRDANGLEPPDIELDFQLDELDGVTAVAARHAAAMQKKAEQLQQQAARLEQPFKAQRIQELEEAAQQLHAQAQEAAKMAQETAQETVQMAQALPRIEVQNYLENVQRQNQHLYDRLLNEREMEMETLRLAEEIRRMPEGDARDERIAALRDRLDEIFEMKQENRRQEMEQLKERLEDLQEKLEQRERLRTDIIDRRLRQLLRMGESLNW